jgi:glycine hydroxymethyltransferase
VLLNAKALAAGLEECGCRVISGGTDTHVMLVDVFAKGVRGKEAEAALDRAYITANKNTIPFDVNPPLNPSGIRFGSPAVTTRGFGEAEMKTVAGLITRVLENIANENVLAEVRREVGKLTNRFPLYEWKLRTAVTR